MNRDAIMQKLKDQQMRILQLSHQYDGVKKLFDAAAMQNNGTECDRLRFQLHELLDLQLDCVAMTMLLTRSFIEGDDPEPPRSFH